MARLVILRGPGQGRAFDVLGGASIGRLPSNSVQLAGDKISRRHAEIVRENNLYVITNLGSRNGVIVNGRKAERTVLRSGDRIEIGNALLLFELDDDQDELTRCVDGEASAEEAAGDWVGAGKLSSGEPVLFAEDAAASAEHFEKSVDVDGQPPGSAPSSPEELLARLRDANRKLKALHDVSDAIHETFDLSKLLHRILDLVLDIFEAERAVVLLYDQADGVLRPAAARNRHKASARLAVSQTVVDYVARRMRSVISADALADPRFDPSDSIAMQNINSVMCVPLTSKGKSQGVLYVDTRHGAAAADGRRRFQQDHLRLLTIIARQAANAIDNARSYADLRQEREELKRQVTEKYRIVGDSPRLQAVLEEVRQVAHGDTTILICGETGSGKELIARAIHEESVRSNGPFVVVNCASIPEALLESELFGHEKGAFTGAVQSRMGKFEQANLGTLFLDEVGEISPALQTKLLRAVEQKEFDRVGGTHPVSVDVRIVAATNRDLAQMVKDGEFREDLYYRLAVVPLKLPPLRERREDIPVLAQHFLEMLARDMSRHAPALGEESLRLMLAYDWPGNIRELKNAMERAILLNRSGTIEPFDLPPAILAPARGSSGEPASASGGLLPLASAVAETERRAIVEALRQAGGVKLKAAELLGVSRPTLDKKLREYSLLKDDAPQDDRS